MSRGCRTVVQFLVKSNCLINDGLLVQIQLDIYQEKFF